MSTASYPYAPLRTTPNPADRGTALFEMGEADALAGLPVCASHATDADYLDGYGSVYEAAADAVRRESDAPRPFHLAA